MIDTDHPLNKALRLDRFTCRGTCVVVAAAGLILMGQALGQTAPKLSAIGYGSLQEALDANPGQMIYVPPGDYKTSQKIRLTQDRSGLFGPGRIIQTNPDLPLIEVERATGVRIRDLTLSRAEGRTQTGAEGILAIQCRDLVIEDVQVLDNRTRSAAIVLRQSIPANVQGRSFAPLLDDRPYVANAAIFGELTYHGYYDPQRSIRTETHKLIANFSTAPSFQDPSQQWRPRSDPAVPEAPAATFHPHLELYDLVHDPWEQVNLVDKPEHAAVRTELARRLYQHMAETDDPLLRGAVTPPQHETTLKLLQGEPAAKTGG